MSAKHTPGPWYWHTDHAGNVSIRTPDRGNLIVMDFTRKGMQSAGPRFAVWPGWSQGKPRERLGGILEPLLVDSHPDARLIAAAPELLEACKLIEANAAVWVGTPETATAVRKLRDAIAKATGETP